MATPPNATIYIGSESPTFWLDDGDIVLVAVEPATKNLVGFLVERFRLRGASNVFDDMLALDPDAGALGPKWGDYPAVKLSEDAVTVEFLLWCIYARIYEQSFPDLVKMSAGKLLLIYSAALKYDIPLVVVLAENQLRWVFIAD